MKQALDLWPNGADEGLRLDVLDRLGECAQLSGMGAEAARAWREVAAGRRQRGEVQAAAFAERKLANAAELQGHWEAALAAHEAAAQSFAAGGLLAECAAEHLAAAAHMRSAGRYRAALDLLHLAEEEALRAARPDLQARILGLIGNVLARMGRVTQGLALVQEGLALALEKNLAGAAAEVYQRLADSLEHAGEYAAAKETYLVGFDFCQANAVPATAQLCVACLTVVLRHTGEWEQAMRLCREVLGSGDSTAHARAVAGGMLGSLYALRGRRGRPNRRCSRRRRWHGRSSWRPWSCCRPGGWRWWKNSTGQTTGRPSTHALCSTAGSTWRTSTMPCRRCGGWSRFWRRTGQMAKRAPAPMRSPRSPRPAASRRRCRRSPTLGRGCAA